MQVCYWYPVFPRFILITTSVLPNLISEFFLILFQVSVSTFPFLVWYRTFISFQNNPKFTKHTLWLNVIGSAGDYNTYSNMPNIKPFLPNFLKRIPGKTQIWLASWSQYLTSYWSPRLWLVKCISVWSFNIFRNDMLCSFWWLFQI